MAEEIHNASLVIPRSIVLSILINGLLGFTMIIAVLFTLGDVDRVLSSKTGFPLIEIFLQATNSIAGSAAMASLIVVLAISATVGIMAGASRMLWSFSRDKGVPGWRQIEKVNARSRVPLVSIAVTTAVSI